MNFKRNNSATTTAIKTSNCNNKRDLCKRDDNNLHDDDDDVDDADLMAFLNSSNQKKRFKSTISSTANEMSTRDNPNDIKLYKIIEFTKTADYLQLNLKLNSDSNINAKCYLHDSWSNCLVEENFLVNIIQNDEKSKSENVVEAEGSVYHIRDTTDSIVIINPQIILSGTTILSSLHCLRRSVLGWKFREQVKGNSHMLLGTVLHQLFQDAIKTKKIDKLNLNKILMELLKRKIYINQLFEIDCAEEDIIKEAVQYLDNIESWLRKHLNTTGATGAVATPKTTCNHNDNNFTINSIRDIEESIWLPKYGLKGKLDLTIKLKNKKILPIELKSGRSTFSVEHEGQVMLYTLLNNHVRITTSNLNGLLLYLKDSKMKFIKLNKNNLNGLIQLRNELVFYICTSYTDALPAAINDIRSCSKCPLLTVCSLLSSGDSSGSLYTQPIEHLSESHKEYFFKWYKMLNLEFKTDYLNENLNLFQMSMNENESLEKTGCTIGYLKLLPSGRSANKENIVANGSDTEFVAHTFQRLSDKPFSLSNLQIRENDMVLVSRQVNTHIGLSQGFIKTIKQNSDTLVITLQLDKCLHDDEGHTSEEFYRIDRISFRSQICLNYINLNKLFLTSPSSTVTRNLRELIIDKRTPQFDSHLPKESITKTKSLFKKLNQSQQKAVLRTLMAKDFLVIKGYPGTGKTSTIAALIAILIVLDKKVLFTSYTNSAVDNLLLKLVKEYPTVDFTRIGSYDRIHDVIKKYEAETQTRNITNTKDLKAFYDNKQLIATTCSSITHAVFNQIQFDYCIVDEASQVLQTTCIGPLLCSKKFILVGDSQQLPPIIKNKDARLGGMDVSLFEYLDSKEGSVELVHQYRMNREIMSLANEITYDSKLQCISDKVADKRLQIDQDFLNKITLDKIKKIFEKSVVFIDTTKLIKGQTEVFKNSNQLECDVIKKLTGLFLKHSDCKSNESIGIIAPYNDQVKLLKRNLTENIEINTVDQFQGRDKRIIIVSYTNSIITHDADSVTKEFEILNDKRRLTVAITRAKEKLILVGCAQTLVRYRPIQSLIDSVNAHDYTVQLDSLTELDL